MISLGLAITQMTTASAVASLFKPLSENEIREVRTAFDAMKKDPRGPYLRIRWYCKDGTVQAPAGTPCAEHGGGVQYAERNASALRLAELQFDVGVILQSLSFEQFANADEDFNLPKQLVLQNYLIEVDDGWISRRARYYRGARQIEDEEAQGESFLQKLFSDGAWVDRNFLLARQLTAIVPHQAMTAQASSKIRNLATEIAGLEVDFQTLRVKIHSYPSASDLEAVEKFMQRKGLSEETEAKLASLRDQIRQLYDPRRLQMALDRYQKRLPGLASELEGVRKALQGDNPADSIRVIAGLAAKLRMDIASSVAESASNLRRLDLMVLLQDKAFALSQELNQGAPLPRGRRVSDLKMYFDLAYASGFLSVREVEALQGELAGFAARDEMPASEYRSRVAYLTRSLDWGRSAVQGVFGPVVDRYLAVEPKAAGFSDALIRGSILLPLATQLGRLNTDADATLGQSHRLLGRSVSQGVRGLNPGVARGILEIVERNEPEWLPDPKKIYVIPDTVADLKPMAGILTLDAGNLLSHAQLLARNLGIPNAAISPTLLPDLRAYQGNLVFFAVAPAGRVILKRLSEMTLEETALVEDKREQAITKVRLDTSRLQLKRAEPVPLEQLRATDSGALVGPKAANLGQLHHYFPGRVSAGVALPFGMYRRHIARPFEGGQTLETEIREAYQTAQRMTDQGVDSAQINDFMFPRLARFRRAIEEMEWDPENRRLVLEALQKTFPDGVSGGVFVRSDTNAEDLPQFSGAGLNLTIPNQRSVENILTSIKKVWASPFSERAYLWRRQLVLNQEDVYTSVLLLQSVPSDMSGVLITSGLNMGNAADLTVVVAEGVGGVVDGDSAETILVHPDATIKLLSQAKAPYRRRLGAKGGVEVVPCSKRDTLLTAEKITQLLATVAEWKRQVPPSPEASTWDMEFGFVGSKLWLFQIRPFVGHRNQQVLRQLERLYRQPEQATAPLSLRKPI